MGGGLIHIGWKQGRGGREEHGGTHRRGGRVDVLMMNLSFFVGDYIRYAGLNRNK